MSVGYLSDWGNFYPFAVLECFEKKNNNDFQTLLDQQIEEKNILKNSLESEIDAAKSLMKPCSSNFRLCLGNLIGVLPVIVESILKFAGVLSCGGIGGIPGCAG